MGVDVKDLPPAYQAQALRKWAEQERKKKRPPLPCPADAGPGKPANRKVSGYRAGQRWKLDVENASADDVQHAFIAVTCAPDGEPEQEDQGKV